MFHLKKRKNFFRISQLIMLAVFLLMLSGCSAGVNSDTAGTEQYCTISISCSMALEHADRLPENLAEMLPEDGWILKPVQIDLKDGDTVLDVLLRAVREHNIHMEYVDTPLYDSAYIEGIGNLYEFDAGDHSGWMYSVNGEFPNYGCSSSEVADGDVICWVYTCDLGKDVGSRYEVQQ